MAARIEDYAIVGDTHTVALIARDGSVDWLCLPRVDSGACFAALLGGPENGRWAVAPAGGVRETRRAYRGHTLVLQTEHHTDEGVVRVIDLMPRRSRFPTLVRIVEGVSGRVPMRSELVVRFDYGNIVPWVRQHTGGVSALAGPDALFLRTPVPLRGEGLTTVAEFTVGPGERVPFALTWTPPHEHPPPLVDPERALAETERLWSEWSSRCTYSGHWHDTVMRSLITLKALTYAPTGGIVAAATTSLPEAIGGVRNWDYRYCWLRDATFTLWALMGAGYRQEASAWRDWLLRAVAGDPGDLQILYGPSGERRLPEWEVGWLSGYEGSRPVRVGNAAVDQLQLDVYGEVMDALHQARVAGVHPDAAAWAVQEALMEFLEGAWEQPDEGIWEVRGGRRQFTHSKVMAWVAFDRAVQAVERFGLPGPVDRWRRARDEVHRQVCERAVDPDRGVFTQSYDSRHLDAAVLLIPLVGFLPPGDPRVVATIDAVERELKVDGLVMRYTQDGSGVDGLPGGEGAFLPCSFWLVDCLALMGRGTEATTMFRSLLDLRNDVGLLSEEYDPVGRRQLGNVPQAFTHVGLVNSALNLSEEHRGPAALRGGRPG